MEHPLITDADDLSNQDLQQRVSDLTKKLSMAYRMNNAQLIGQVRMALETYQNKLQERLKAEYEKHNKGTDFGDRIDIS